MFGGFVFIEVLDCWGSPHFFLVNKLNLFSLSFLADWASEMVEEDGGGRLWARGSEGPATGSSVTDCAALSMAWVHVCSSSCGSTCQRVKRCPIKQGFHLKHWSMCDKVVLWKKLTSSLHWNRYSLPSPSLGIADNSRRSMLVTFWNIVVVSGWSFKRPQYFRM